MEIILYSNKQILGGFVLVILIGLLFASNIMLTNLEGGINMSYFISPIIFTICIISILYISSLRKSINQTYDKYVLPDNFSIYNCPDGYRKEVEGENIKCQPINPNGSAPTENIEGFKNNSKIETFDNTLSNNCIVSRAYNGSSIQQYCNNKNMDVSDTVTCGGGATDTDFAFNVYGNAYNNTSDVTSNQCSETKSNMCCISRDTCSNKCNYNNLKYKAGDNICTGSGSFISGVAQYYSYGHYTDNTGNNVIESIDTNDISKYNFLTLGSGNTNYVVNQEVNRVDKQNKTCSVDDCCTCDINRDRIEDNGKLTRCGECKNGFSNSNNGDCICDETRVVIGGNCVCKENREEDINGNCVCKVGYIEDSSSNCVLEQPVETPLVDTPVVDTPLTPPPTPTPTPPTPTPTPPTPTPTPPTTPPPPTTTTTIPPPPPTTTTTTTIPPPPPTTTTPTQTPPVGTSSEQQGTLINNVTDTIIETSNSAPYIETYNWPKKAFFLNGDDTYCSKDVIRDNGCFNKFPNRVEKCNKIVEFLKDYNEVLNNWTDFQKECQI